MYDSIETWNFFVDNTHATRNSLALPNFLSLIYSLPCYFISIYGYMIARKTGGIRDK